MAWLLAAVAGCAVVSPAVPPPAPGDVERFAEWTASGRLAMVTGEEGGNGSFVWRQTGASTSLSIRGPLGAGAVEILSDGRSLSVTDGAGRIVDAAQAEAALRARLGADLPWIELRYWMQGVPAPTSPAEVGDARVEPLRVIDQAGWQIAYESFRTVSGAALPGRFTAARGAVRLKVVVDDWAVTPQRAVSP